MTTIELLERTKAAWGSIRSASAEEKDRLLLAMAESLEANSEDILRENAKDMEAAKGAIYDVMLDRLALTESRIHAMAEGIREAAALPDHVGRALAQFKRPNGMTITKRQVPLGLVAIIYESRPNVTSDAAALCIKSGNVCMLRSGKEAYRSSHAIVTALKAGVESVGGDIFERRTIREGTLDPMIWRRDRNADAVVLANKDQRHGKVLIRNPRRHIDRADRGRVIRRSVAKRT